MPRKQRDDDKRQDDRGGRAEQIEPQRQGQVVALPKAMRRRRAAKDENEGEDTPEQLQSLARARRPRCCHSGAGEAEARNP